MATATKDNIRSTLIRATKNINQLIAYELGIDKFRHIENAAQAMIFQLVEHGPKHVIVFDPAGVVIGYSVVELTE
jgi:hypothetical protein